MFTAVAEMEETDNRPSSDVRFYCDNDRMDMNRWVLVPDDPIDQQPNSGRARDLKEWKDDINEVKRRPGHYGCQSNFAGGELMLGVTYTQKVVHPLGENRHRSTITVRHPVAEL
jgi:hypothetical protein